MSWGSGDQRSCDKESNDSPYLFYLLYELYYGLLEKNQVNDHLFYVLDLFHLFVYFMNLNVFVYSIYVIFGPLDKIKKMNTIKKKYGDLFCFIYFIYVLIYLFYFWAPGQN